MTDMVRQVSERAGDRATSEDHLHVPPSSPLPESRLSPAPSPTPVGPPAHVGGGALFDPYCDECFGPWAVWRPMKQRMLCERCDPKIAVLCESCSQNLA